MMAWKSKLITDLQTVPETYLTEGLNGNPDYYYFLSV